MRLFASGPMVAPARENVLYCCNRVDVAQLVEQRIRKTTVDHFTLENQQVFNNIFIV